MSLRADVLRLTHGALVEFFVLDLTALGGPVYRFCNFVNELQQPVVWQGQTYQPFPVEGSGWDRSAQGTLPRPTLRISDLTGLVGVLVRSYQGLAGARVIRKRTLATYLDAVNFTAGNPQADPLTHWPDQVWEVARRTRDNGLAIEFELRAAIDVAGVQLPLRQIIQNTCAWQYRSPECGYAGAAVADLNDQPTSDPAQDKCSRRLAGCRLRFPNALGGLPYGGFPTAGLTRL